MESYTFSSLLQGYRNFAKAFWVTYSLDFNTLDFVLKHDLKPIMDPCYFHLICDPEKLDESIVKVKKGQKKINKLIGLQEYCTISIQPAEGAFHSKILFLASETQILLLIGSANATSSGVLSNQDLIGFYHYSENEREHLEEISELFHYIRSFPGWGEDAREDLKIVEEWFPFSPPGAGRDRVLAIPARKCLLDQIEPQLKTMGEIKEINIFSPFFDDSFAAVASIYERFETKLNIYSPIETVEVISSKRFPNDIKFYYSDNLLKKGFHAKFYEFVFEHSSIVFWGSANCSYSGLLHPGRNYEVLIKSVMTREEVLAYWGDIANASPKDAIYLSKKKSDQNKDNPRFEILLLEIKREDDLNIITFGGDPEALQNASIVGINKQSKKQRYTILKCDNSKLAIHYDKNLVLLYVDRGGECISNHLYSNNAGAIAERITGSKKEREAAAEVNGKTHLRFIFSLFNLDNQTKPKTFSAANRSNNGFWRLPQYSQRHSRAGITNINAFLQERLNEFRTNQDEDNDDEPPTTQQTPGPTKPVTKVADDTTFTKLVAKQSKILLDNIAGLERLDEVDQIDSREWVRALFMLIVCLLKEFKSLPAISKTEIGDAIKMLNRICKVSIWIYTKFSVDKYDEKMNEAVRCVFDILQFLTMYNYAHYREINGYLEFDGSFTEIQKEAKLGLFYKHVFLSSLKSRKRSSEHNRYTIQDISSKLPNLRIANKFLNQFQNKSGELYDEIVAETKICYIKGRNKSEKLLYVNKANGEFRFERVFGGECSSKSKSNIRLCKTIDY